MEINLEKIKKIDETLDKIRQNIHALSASLNDYTLSDILTDDEKKHFKIQRNCINNLFGIIPYNIPYNK